MLRWLIVVLALALMIPACKDPCLLNHQVRVKFDWQYSFVAMDSDWNGYTTEQLKDSLQSNISTVFTDADQLLVVDTLPDYIIRVQSVEAYSGDETMTRTRPCSTRGWVGNLLLGHDEISFQLHYIRLDVKINLINAATGNGKLLYPSGYEEQSIYQPVSTDSVNCNPYQIDGTPTTTGVMSAAMHSIHNTVRCQIHVWQNL